MTIKQIASAIAALVILGAIYGAYQYPKLVAVGGTSSSSTNLNTAKFAAIAGISLASPGTVGATGANGTSTSILNPAGTDLYISAIKAGCQSVGTSKTAYTGTGLASLTLSVSTTSTAAPAAVGTNLVAGAALTLSTSTVQFIDASSTASQSSGAAGSSFNNVIWPSGTYLTFQTNATNTAVCTFGADYFNS